MSFFPVIEKPTFPFVPNMPGVPTLIRPAIGFDDFASVLNGRANDRLWRLTSIDYQWGIFTQEDKLLVEADSVLDLGFKNEQKVANYPMQAGAFSSYNKVAEPYHTTVRLVKGGQLQVAQDRSTDSGTLLSSGYRIRGDFLDIIDKASRSLALYKVVTPEQTYLNCNITSYSYKREQSRGAYQLVVDIELVEVRQVQASYSHSADPQSTRNAKDIGAVPTVNNGKVQGQPLLMDSIRLPNQTPKLFLA